MKRVTAEKFSAMVEAGVFGERRVFLWDGRIVEKSIRTTFQAFVAARIDEVVFPLVPGGWEIWHGNPIRLGPEDVPLPDLALIRGLLERYRHRSPAAEDVDVVIEIDADDRVSRYARAGVPTYWMANTTRRRIIEHRGPRVVGGVASYETVAEHGAGGEVELILDGAVVGRVALAEVF